MKFAALIVGLAILGCSPIIEQARYADLPDPGNCVATCARTGPIVLRPLLCQTTCADDKGRLTYLPASESGALGQVFGPAAGLARAVVIPITPVP